MARSKNIVATEMNISVLAEYVAKSVDGIVRQIDAVDAPHMRRCIKAGLLDATTERVGRGFAWRVSAKGIDALDRARRDDFTIAALAKVSA